MKRFALLAVLCLWGCGSSSWARPMGEGDFGRKRFLVTCKRDIGLCYQRAADTCENGFDVSDEKPDMQIPQNSGAIIVDCR